ncbi:MAG: PASTA domain-containing protein [Acidobacteria bacterium]|nr:PASTA domain-containing protein [Acidobacteriota bacterium]
MKAQQQEVIRKNRLIFVGIFFLIWAGLIIHKQVELQFSKRSFLISKKEEQQTGIVKLIPQRGRIIDRNGRSMAMSMDVDSIYAVPYEIENIDKTAREVSEKLRIGYRKVLSKLRSNKGFVWLKRKVEPYEARAISNADIKGIYSYKENKRYYPHDDLASAVLGFAGIDNDGLAGIEYQYDEILKGKPGAIIALKDARRKRITTGQLIKNVPTSGEDIALTIDSTIQQYLEEELNAASTKYKVKQSFGIIMQPYTGEILAIASYPSYDLNRYYIFSPDIHKNRAIQIAYEPGSTFKIATAAVALEEKLVKESDKFFCENGSKQIGDRVINDYKPFGTLNFEDIIVYSSNIGILKVGEKIGKEKFYKWLKFFEFGEKTGINLPGENQGILRPTSKWSQDSLASISFGQEISVNSLQLLRFVSAIGNGGYLIKPKIFLGDDPLGTTNEKKKILSDRVCESLKHMMIEVVNRGTGKKAQIENYITAGKTGTAQKVGKNGGAYLANKYIASFVGFVPADNPQIAMVIVMDENVGLTDGGDVAAPVFANVAEKTLRYLGAVPEDEKRYYKMPGHLDEKTYKYLLADFRLKTKSIENAYLSSGEVVIDEVSGLDNGVRNVIMPDLRGKSYREVFEILTKLNLYPQLVGSGMAYKQVPGPGVLVESKSKCHVYFSRSGS